MEQEGTGSAGSPARPLHVYDRSRLPVAPGRNRDRTDDIFATGDESVPKLTKFPLPLFGFLAGWAWRNRLDKRLKPHVSNKNSHLLGKSKWLFSGGGGLITPQNLLFRNNLYYNDLRKSRFRRFPKKGTQIDPIKAPTPCSRDTGSIRQESNP